MAALGTAIAASGTRSTGSPPRPSAISQGDSLSAAADRGRILGSDKTNTWILIVSDFQCPFCKDWHDKTWGAIDKEYVKTGRVRVAYVNMPLSIHPNARPAALAAMCASAQGKFWPMSDRLFETQAKWKDLKDPQAFFDSLATSVGANAERQRQCLKAPSIAAMVDADRVRMSRAGAGSTPTFFIGGSKVEGAQPLATFKKVIDAELAAAKR